MGVIEFSDDEFKEDDEVRFCPHCLDYGFKEKLGPKILMPQEPRPVDYENWLQCVSCGTVYATHEVTKESEIKDVVETIDSPFDSGVEFLGIDSRKSRNKKRKQDDDFDYINDEDLKRELKKGSKLLSYSEQMPQ